MQPAGGLVFLEDEIRVYYSGARTPHGVREWDRPEPRCGIGFAALKPDRFVSLAAAAEECRLLTRPLKTASPEFYVNAAVAKEGCVRIEVADLEAKPIQGFELENCLPITGDSVRHRVQWQGNPSAAQLAGPWIRLRVSAAHARIYALFCCREEEAAQYWRFRIPHARASLWERFPAFDAAASS